MDEERVKQVAWALQRLVVEGGDNNFLVLSMGEPYVQFAGEKGARTLYAEAASNAFLDSMHLDPDAEERLVALGFAPPDEEVENFHREFDLAPPDAFLAIAALALRAFDEVYGGKPDDFEMELNLE